MRDFIIIIFLFFNAFVYSETLYYKNINTSEEDSTLMRVEFPEDCLEIIEINNDQSLEFKNNDAIEKIVSECNTFLKGKKVRDVFKSNSDKILDTGIKVNLIKQLVSPVKWQQSVEKMINDGASEFVEVGPGKVLQGLVRKINPEEI